MTHGIYIHVYYVRNTFIQTWKRLCVSCPRRLLFSYMYACIHAKSLCTQRRVYVHTFIVHIHVSTRYMHSTCVHQHMTIQIDTLKCIIMETRADSVAVKSNGFGLFSLICNDDVKKTLKTHNRCKNRLQTVVCVRSGICSCLSNNAFQSTASSDIHTYAYIHVHICMNPCVYVYIKVATERLRCIHACVYAYIRIHTRT
jgi:hypothetical protein